LCTRAAFHRLGGARADSLRSFPVRYTTFGRKTGLRVSELALGTANFGTTWDAQADYDECRKMFDKFADEGGTFVDTADVYQFGQTETYLADFIASDRDHFVLASKFTQGATQNPGVSKTGNSRKTMVRALDSTLSRLGTDYLDIYWAHWPDSVTPMDEIVSTMDDFVSAGKILHGGFSNFPAWRVAHAATIAEERGYSSTVIGMQTEYSLVERSAERELIPMAEGMGLGTVFFSPLGGGLLTGKYRSTTEGRMTTMAVTVQFEDTTQKTAIIDMLLDVAKDYDRSPSQIAMAWLMQRGRRAGTTVVPIIGPRTMAQLDDYLAALTIELDTDTYDRLDEVSAPQLGQPHEDGEEVTDLVLGGQSGNFDLPAPVS
jgi:aryl-alcohol dehydrogenase-like predicted oxidoreductase